MTIHHIPIERRFAAPSDSKLADADDLSFWGESTFGNLGWEDFVNNHCVVVLAEGKCGKTHEFKKRNEVLRANGETSFFIPLEQLQDSDVLEILSSDEEFEWEEWLADKDKPAVFFLDAVDELKLRQGTLRKALKKLKDTMGEALPRARFFISCRPADWNEEIDSKALSTILPQTKVDETTLERIDGEQVFLQVISRRDKQRKDKDIGNNDSSSFIRVVSLLPFSQSESQEFAELYSPSMSKEFVSQLSEKELWHLYRYPYEIISALDQLSEHGRLGNLEEQLIYGVNQKLSEVSTKKRNNLSLEKAREGAERVALALFLTKTRSVKSASALSKESAIKIQDVLTDWTLDECAELLAKSIFDPTGVESFRFHHRSTQEYLAAKRLKKLRELGLNTNDLFCMLFANVRDEAVVIPSMQPVTAWLALWYADIYNEVKARSPSVMFRQGIPSLLPLERREELIRKYVEMYSKDKTWRGLRLGFSELKRLSTPELSPVIHELWEKAYCGFETRELLLELIYLTPMPECSDLAIKALYDEALPVQHRTYAGWSVLEFGENKDKKKVGKAVVEGTWPRKLVRSLVSNLVPEALCVFDFLKVAKFLPESPNNVHGVGYSLMNATKSESLSIEQVKWLRDELSQAIWNSRCADSRIYSANSKYDHFIGSIIQTCLSTASIEEENKEQWAWCLAIAFHFGDRRTSIIASDEIKTLEKLLSQNLKLREAYYWACLRLAEEVESVDNLMFSDYLIDYDNVLAPFTVDDCPWLEKAFNAGKSKNIKDAAFYRLLQLVKEDSSSKVSHFLSSSTLKGTEYGDVLERTLNPPKPKLDEYELEHQEQMKKYAEKEAKRIDGWKSWRDDVLTSKDFCLGDAEYSKTLYNLFKFLKQNEEPYKWGAWDSNLIERSFSKNFVDALRPRLSEYWKRAAINLFSERDVEAKNSYSYESLLALTAVKCDSEKLHWAAGLSDEQVRQAVKISTIELNGFADYLQLLIRAFPSLVEDVFKLEAENQLDDFDELGAAPLLHDALYSKHLIIKSGVIKAILMKLNAIKVGMFKGSSTDLKYAFELVAQYGEDSSKSSLADVVDSFLDELIDSVEERNVWVSRLANLDLKRGCDRIMEYTQNDRSEGSEGLFAAVFGDRYSKKQPTFDDLDVTQRLALLKPLLIRSYEVVQPSSDIVHEGTYTPGRRDYAEHARGFLLESLIKSDSVNTIDTLYELSKMDLFDDLSCRFEQAAVEIAARISEPKPMPVERFNLFDKDRNYLPYDDHSLFMVMNNRLDDFEHSLLNDEASIVDTLRKVEGETELRRFISNHLIRDSRGAYTVNQEAVVANEKRTDIRLNVDRINKYASIELKLDDSRHKWSGTALKTALVDQLIGRYLNHEKCYVGCLLICMREARSWEHPESERRMNLSETVTWLQGIADDITSHRPQLLVSVKGIDYSKIANE